MKLKNSATLWKKVLLRKQGIINQSQKSILHHDKYIATNDFNKFSGTLFDERSKQAKLSTKADATDFIFKDIFW